MLKSNTSLRLKEIMKIKNIRQIDIINKAIPYCEKYNVKLSRGDLSQYIAGKVEPRQNKLYILALALNVSEAWLMGCDVPMERITADKQQLDNMQFALYDEIKDLTDEQKSDVLKYVNFIKSQRKENKKDDK